MIILQVLSFVAENERINIKQRQAEGIRIAKEKGVKFGRPKATLPHNTINILDKYINRKLTNIEATKLIGVSRGTFFRLVKERKLLKNNMKIKAITKRKNLDTLIVSRLVYYYGAGNRNRTGIFAMARRYNSRYTIPASNALIL